MKTRMVLLAGMSALVLGGTMVGCAATGGAAGGGIVSASARDAAILAKSAATNAGKAQAALDKRNASAAIGYAEGAVAAMPQSAEYRMLLGQSYLQAGRFTSAGQAFADTLRLSPANGKAALNLALSQVATGDWQSARTTLDTHAAIIPASDRGLALSLAGNTAGGIALLTEVARSPEGNAKVRQNLALSLAMAGQWQGARVVAAADMAPGDVDARLEQWAKFAQPEHAYDQVASLLGVRAVADAGQPVALALNVDRNAAPIGLAAVEPSRAQETASVEAPEAPIALAASTVVQSVPDAQPGAAIGFSKIVFAPRREVVQSLPTMMLRPSGGPIKLATVERSIGFAGRGGAPKLVRAIPAAMPLRVQGGWFVQLGAFENAAVARDAWGRATRRFATFAGHQPNGVTFKTGGDEFYRLSVGGFTRVEANMICRQYRARGGACFVRAGAGDQMAQWFHKSDVQLASRS